MMVMMTLMNKTWTMMIVLTIIIMETYGSDGGGSIVPKLGFTLCKPTFLKRSLDRHAVRRTDMH